MRHEFNTQILQETTHRPWAMPDRPWVMTQTWHDLLFAHWPLPPERLRLPAPFDLDLFQDRAWIGVVPFHMTNVAPRGVPALPWISAFPELNVRTYVTVGGKPGVFFFSLDAGRALAVYAAWLSLRLPYYTARMQVAREADTVVYRSRRVGGEARFDARYRPIAPSVAPVPGTLEYFLTERYCLYAVNHFGVAYRLEIHHPPWPLQPAEATIARNTMAQASGIRLPDVPPLLHFSRRQDVVAFVPERVA